MNIQSSAMLIAQRGDRPSRTALPLPQALAGVDPELLDEETRRQVRPVMLAPGVSVAPLSAVPGGGDAVPGRLPKVRIVANSLAVDDEWFVIDELAKNMVGAPPGISHLLDLRQAYVLGERAAAAFERDGLTVQSTAAGIRLTQKLIDLATNSIPGLGRYAPYGSLIGLVLEGAAASLEIVGTPDRSSQTPFAPPGRTP